MGTIRRQSIISSMVVYIGFALGLVNTYLFARGFTETQYGLTGSFIAIANIMFSLSHLGTLYYVYKFFPYYQDNLPEEENDQFTWTILLSFIGFLIVLACGIIFKDLVVQKFNTNSPDLVTYFYWVFPFGFGLTLFSLLEAFAWQFQKSVLTIFLREVGFRLLTTVLITCTFLGVIKSFDLFIKIYAFTYLVVAIILLSYLIKTKKIHLHFSFSRVTKKFYKKIVRLMGMLWFSGLIFNVAQVFDTLVIAAVLPAGLAYAGIYTLAQNVASLIQAPQRAILAASIAPLSRSWKDKDYDRINRIYHRSSINQLVFAAGMFVLIWLNFTDGVLTFKLREGYVDARPVFLYIGLMRVIDLGTGVNAQVISTSIYWRMDVYAGLVLLVLAIPLNYILTKSIGITGTAISNLIAMTAYNAVRYFFLLKKFKMQPFTAKTLYTLILGVVGYYICHLLFSGYYGFGWIVLRSTVFIAIYATGVLALNISPDIKPVLQTVRDRITRRFK